MIKIQIGQAEIELDDVSPNWINQQINLRRTDGITVCVRVIIDEGGLNMLLSTPTCGSSGGIPRPPNQREKAVFDLWEQRGLNKAGFSGGNLVAFLKQLKNI